MKDRVPLYPGRVKLVPVAGQSNVYDMERADAPTEAGTPLNKASLLKDATAAMYGLGAAAVPDDIVRKVPRNIGDFRASALDLEALTGGAYLRCDGRTISKADYPVLEPLIQYRYGILPAETKWAMPSVGGNLRGKYWESAGQLLRFSANSSNDTYYIYRYNTSTNAQTLLFSEKLTSIYVDRQESCVPASANGRYLAVKIQTGSSDQVVKVVDLTLKAVVLSGVAGSVTKIREELVAAVYQNATLYFATLQLVNGSSSMHLYSLTDGADPKQIGSVSLTCEQYQAPLTIHGDYIYYSYNSSLARMKWIDGTKSTVTTARTPSTKSMGVVGANLVYPAGDDIVVYDPNTGAESIVDTTQFRAVCPERSLWPRFSAWCPAQTSGHIMQVDGVICRLDTSAGYRLIPLIATDLQSAGYNPLSPSWAVKGSDLLYDAHPNAAVLPTGSYPFTQYIKAKNTAV